MENLFLPGQPLSNLFTFDSNSICACLCLVIFFIATNYDLIDSVDGRNQFFFLFWIIFFVRYHRNWLAFLVQPLLEATKTNTQMLNTIDKRRNTEQIRHQIYLLLLLLLLKFTFTPNENKPNNRKTEKWWMKQPGKHFVITNLLIIPGHPWVQNKSYNYSPMVKSERKKIPWILSLATI